MLSKPLRWMLVFIFITSMANVIAAPVVTPDNPCSDASLRDITDRGSITNTVCVLPPSTMMLEAGDQYKRYTRDLSQQIYPQATLFVGLPADTEFAVILPTYNQQSIAPDSGFSATAVGVKHIVTSGRDWAVGAELFITPPGGSAGFGNQGVGVIVNGMATYKVNATTFMALMMGVNTSTEGRFAGGRRFNSFNPSLVLSHALTENVNVFGEVFAQTKTTPDTGANYNADCGILYSLTPNVVFDLEVAQQLGHELASFKQFVGAGVTVIF